MRRTRVIALAALAVSVGAMVFAAGGTSIGAVTSDVVVICWDENDQPQNATYVLSIAQTFQQCTDAGLERQKLLDLRNNGAGPPGPQGAQGPQGPQGPQGAQGPPGTPATTASAWGHVTRSGALQRAVGVLRARRLSQGRVEVLLTRRDNCVVQVTPHEAIDRAPVARSENATIARAPGSRIRFEFDNINNGRVQPWTTAFDFVAHCRAR